MFAKVGNRTLFDEFTEGTYYHYYAGYVTGKTDLGMKEYPSYDEGY